MQSLNASSFKSQKDTHYIYSFLMDQILSTLICKIKTRNPGKVKLSKIKINLITVILVTFDRQIIQNKKIFRKCP